MRASLNRSDLIEIMQHKLRELPPAAVDVAVRLIFAEITKALAEGGRVEIRGFGVFEVRHCDAREGRNPRTGARVAVPATKGVHWKTGKRLAVDLNATSPGSLDKVNRIQRDGGGQDVKIGTPPIRSERSRLALAVDGA